MSAPDTAPTDKPGFSEADLAYIDREYATLEQLCADRSETAEEVRRLIGEHRLPQPTYVLPDGTEMYPPDFFELLDGAGDVAGVRAHFEDRYRATTSAISLTGMEPQEDWESYLTGEFGVCLREVTPEAMVEKNVLMAQIDLLVSMPNAEDAGWREKLRAAVDDLDTLERPFTDYDRQRWGSTSRDKYIAAVRAQYLAEG
jgi:hypothetical protein